MGLYTDFMERQRPRYTYSSHSQSSRDVYDLEDDDTFYREPARSKQSRYGRSSYAGRHSSQDLYDEPATSHRYSTQRSYIRTAHRPAYKAAYHDDDFGYGYGGDYDSDYMYNVARKRAFRAATGTKAHSGLKRRAYTYHTPAGRRFDYGTDYYHYPSYRSYAEPDHSYYGSRTALAFSSSALHDAADISSASKRQDRRLLNAITNTLYGVELDSVRPSRDISDRAGFRRHLYGNYRRPTFAIEWDADETKPTVRKTSRYRPESLESAQYNRSMNRLQQSKLAKARDDTSDWSLSRFSSQLASPAPPSYSSVIRDHSYSRPAISHKPSTFDEEEYGTSRYSSGYSYSSPYRLEYSSSQRDDDDLGLSPYRSRYSSYAPRTSRQDETGDLDTYSYSSRPTYSSARNLGSPSPYRISYTSRTKEPFDYEDSSLVEASYKSPYDQVRERMKNLHDNYGFRGTDYFRKEPVETSFSASASSSSLKYKPEGYYSVQTKPTISSSEGSVVPYQAKGGSTATSSGGGSSVKTQKTSSYGIQAITSGYGHRPARLHHYNYGYEVPSYETHHYHRSFPADVRKAVVLAVKARPYYGDYHRYHTHRYHSYPAPVVSIPPAITYTRVKPHSGYRTQTDIAVSTGAVQDAYRALNKLERGWAHEDYDVSPLHLHHRVYGHHHGHHIEPYGASHVSRAGLPWGITPRKGRRRHHSRHHLGDHTYGGRTFRRAYSLPPSRPLSYGRLVEQRIESSYSPSARSDYTLPPAVSLSQLRSRTLAARDKLDLARSMYDRYIPAESGAPEDVRASIEGRVGALLTRLDSEAHYHKDRSESNTPLVRPYEPLSISRKATFASSPHVTNSYLRNVEFKMPKKISETRKRAREALCKAKKDPHYYD